MKIAYVDITNFRGVSSGRVYFNGHTVIIGDNNAGKSTIFEAIDLVLGPDRMNRTPVVDEHDFYNGIYFVEDSESPKIEIEALIIDLNDDQIARFKNYLEFWDTESLKLVEAGEIDKVDQEHIVDALRIKFVGSYNPDDDDFEGNTFFCSPEGDDGSFQKFSKRDKRECGFLYLRAIRTGARALSMERGSLLDIILHIREIRPKMWEDVLTQLKNTSVATDPTIGITDILGGIQKTLKEFVPSDWGSEPKLRVSDLTREHLRKTLTVFMSTGEGDYHAPFQHQGTGTINTLVLALLSMIAEAKHNVIFAMEEPEIAIPPYTQKRIIDNIRRKSSQAIFTTHSPFVLEEFPPVHINLVHRGSGGVLDSRAVSFPSTIKVKNYSSEFRLRFSEALLAKRVLLTEGATEATSYSAAGRLLNELDGEDYNSLEAMGIAIFDAMSESAIPVYGEYFRNLGKTVFAVFDRQTPEALEKIQKFVDYPYESNFTGFEDLVIEETSDDVIKAFYIQLLADKEWPTHLDKFKPADNDIAGIKPAVFEYLKWCKGAKGAADLICSASEISEIPATVKHVIHDIGRKLSDPKPTASNDPVQDL